MCVCLFVVVVVVVVRDEERNTEQERRLVDDITAPGGVKAAPPRDSLNRFISRSHSLSLSFVNLLCVCVHMYVCGVCL